VLDCANSQKLFINRISDNPMVFTAMLISFEQLGSLNCKDRYPIIHGAESLESHCDHHSYATFAENLYFSIAPPSDNQQR